MGRHDDNHVQRLPSLQSPSLLRSSLLLPPCRMVQLASMGFGKPIDNALLSEKASLSD